MKSDEVILFSDMDGTMLTDWDRGPYVPARNLDAVRRFLSEGGMFSVATGRQYGEVLRFFGGIRFPVPMVLNNGAVLYDSIKEKVLRKTLLPDPVKKECLDYSRSRLGIWLVAADEQKIYQVESGDPDRDQSLLDRMRPRITEDRYLSMETVKVCFVLADASAFPAAAADVAGFRTAGMFRTAQSSPVFLEVMEKSVGKKAAVMEAVRYAGAEKRTLVCIGDYDNDCGMLTLADIAACPSNASPRLLETAKLVTCSNNECAVADLLEKLRVL